MTPPSSSSIPPRPMSSRRRAGVRRRPFGDGHGHLQPARHRDRMAQSLGAARPVDSRSSVTPLRTRPLPTSAWRPADVPGSAPAAADRSGTAAHLRDHGGTLGRSWLRSRPAAAPRVGDDFRGHRVHARARTQRHRGLHDRRAARWPLRRRPAAGLHRARKSLCEYLCPGVPADRVGPPPFVPTELSSEDLWHVADCCVSRSSPPQIRWRRSGPFSNQWRTSCGGRPTRCSSGPSSGPPWRVRGARGRSTPCAPASAKAANGSGTLRKRFALLLAKGDDDDLCSDDR